MVEDFTERAELAVSSLTGTIKTGPMPQQRGAGQRFLGVQPN
jgi:hypothetical protein